RSRARTVRPTTSTTEPVWRKGRTGIAECGTRSADCPSRPSRPSGPFSSLARRWLAAKRQRAMRGADQRPSAGLFGSWLTMLSLTVGQLAPDFVELGLDLRVDFAA